MTCNEYQNSSKHFIFMTSLLFIFLTFVCKFVSKVARSPSCISEPLSKCY